MAVEEVPQIIEGFVGAEEEFAGVCCRLTVLCFMKRNEILPNNLKKKRDIHWR